MAKAKEGGNNNYTPLKNPELLDGKKETRTISEMAQEKNESFKKDNESFVDLANRSTKVRPPFSERLKEATNQAEKQMVKDEPEKDK